MRPITFGGRSIEPTVQEHKLEVLDMTNERQVNDWLNASLASTAAMPDEVGAAGDKAWDPNEFARQARAEYDRIHRSKPNETPE